MEPKFLTFLIFCVFFRGSEVTANDVTCEFGLKEVNSINDYTCSIRSFDLSGNITQIAIAGAHQADKSDEDVKIVSCYKCTERVELFYINFCHKFQNLEAIELKYLKIEQVDRQIFENCQNLNDLDLSFNKIREISENLLAELPKLIILSFWTNEISSIAPNAFRNQRELQLLSLASNKISSLPPKVFEPLINLKELHMDHNQLKIIHSDSFGAYKRLIYVSFQSNKINAIDEKFIENTAVDILAMSNNICFKDIIADKSEMKEKLRKCFDNYKTDGSEYSA